MLRAIEIENFKAFGDRTRIELAPITLVYGQNSAGKSSILQSLNLLKQSHESRDSGASLLPRSENGIVDLGSFRELLFDHDLDRVLRIGFELMPTDSRRGHIVRKRAGAIGSKQSVGVRLGFGISNKSPDVGLIEIDLTSGSTFDSFATFITRILSPEEQRDVYRMAWGPIRGRVPRRRQRAIGAECKWITDTPDAWHSVYRAWSERRADIYALLAKAADKDEVNLWVDRDEVEDGTLAEKRTNLQKAVKDSLNFYSREFSPDQLIRRMTKGWKGSLIGLDGFLPTPSRPLARNQLPELQLTDWRMSGGRDLSLPTNDVGDRAFQTRRLLEETLDSLFPMGPFRRPPERWYIFTGTSPQDVGYKGDHLPDLLFRRSDLVENANEWLKRLDIGYSLKVKPIGDSDSDLFEVRLIDTRRDGGVEVGLSDVGFGISQILPFLVQSLASTNQLISIEQPEVHIHPRLQADLGELLVECIGRPFHHQYLIETHSEHLLLRLQRLIREGRLAPKDLSIIFVERGPSGSRAKRLHLDEKGEFLDEWPGGFFPERLRELM